jgi:hypothetical protein
MGVIVAKLRNSLKDPDSVKQLSILGDPAPLRWRNGNSYESAWLVCFQYNAKNSYGGYVGLSKGTIVIRASNGPAREITYVNWQTTNTRCPS